MTVKRSYLMSVAAVLLLNLTQVQAAEQDTVQAIIPWDAEGQVYQIDTKTMLFVGALQGVMYIESSKGEMHEAFVMCPVMQALDLESGKTHAHGHCEITASADDVAYAEFNCEGEVGSCEGKFELTDGEGSLTGISGEGGMRVRSPIRALVADVAAGAVIRVSSGLLVVKDLKYRIP